jgi:hypothetical protein
MADKKPDDESNTNMSTMVKPKITFKDNKCLFIKNQLSSIGRMIWNNKKKQFILKDGEDWSMFESEYYFHPSRN